MKAFYFREGNGIENKWYEIKENNLDEAYVIVDLGKKTFGFQRCNFFDDAEEIDNQIKKLCTNYRFDLFGEPGIKNKSTGGYTKKLNHIERFEEYLYNQAKKFGLWE